MNDIFEPRNCKNFDCLRFFKLDLTPRGICTKEMDRDRTNERKDSQSENLERKETSERKGKREREKSIDQKLIKTTDTAPKERKRMAENKRASERAETVGRCKT